MTVAQIKVFLAELVEGSRATACAAAGVTLREATAARDGDAGFERLWRIAEAEARARYQIRSCAR